MENIPNHLTLDSTTQEMQKVAHRQGGYRGTDVCVEQQSYRHNREKALLQNYS